MVNGVLKCRVLALTAVSLMLLAVLPAMAPGAGASYVNPPNERDIRIYSESLGYASIFAGSQDITFYIYIYNGDNDAMDDDDPVNNLNVTIGMQVHDVDGEPVELSPIAGWDNYRSYDSVQLQERNYHRFDGFQFDASPYARPGIYNLTVMISYLTGNMEPITDICYIHFTVYAMAQVGSIEGLYPGDMDKEVSLRVDVRTYITDPTLTLELPREGFSFMGGDRSMTVTRAGTSSYDWYTNVFITVDMDVEPGEYNGTYVLVCENSLGQECTEEGEYTMVVGLLPMVSLTVQDAIIAQGTSSRSLSVVVRNTGNVELFGLRMRIDDASLSYIFPQADHYEGSQAVSDPWVEVGSLPAGFEDVVELDLTFDEAIPVGSHKVMFDFSGYYDDTTYGTRTPLDCYWQYSSSRYYCVVTSNHFTHYLMPETSLVPGPHFMLTVVEAPVELTVEALSVPSVGARIMDESITLRIANVGNVDYGSMSVSMETRSDKSPFLNPVDASATTTEEVKVGDLDSGEEAEVVLHVTIPAGTSLGVYKVPLYVTAVDRNMGRQISTEVVARVTVMGKGPALTVTETENTQVEPGEDFTLSIEVFNDGDDIARDVVIGACPEHQAEANSPAPACLPVLVGDIEPGKSVVVDIDMSCGPSVSRGHVFPVHFKVDFTDSFGGHPDEVASIQTVSVETTGSDEKVVKEDFYDRTAGLMALAVVALVAAVVVYAAGQFRLHRGGGNGPGAARREEEAPAATPSRGGWVHQESGQKPRVEVTQWQQAPPEQRPPGQ